MQLDNYHAGTSAAAALTVETWKLAAESNPDMLDTGLHSIQVSCGLRSLDVTVDWSASRGPHATAAGACRQVRRPALISGASHHVLAQVWTGRRYLE